MLRASHGLARKEPTRSASDFHRSRVRPMRTNYSMRLCFGVERFAPVEKDRRKSVNV